MKQQFAIANGGLYLERNRQLSMVLCDASVWSSKKKARQFLDGDVRGWRALGYQIEPIAA